MDEVRFERTLCETCGEPLFLNKEECKNFIERKMKEGYIVCSCCGAKQTMDDNLSF
jgi:RNase P subunit RPR2